MKISYIVQVLLRGGIPFVIMGGISGIMKLQNMSTFQIKSTFLTGVIISIVSATSIIYQVDHWSLMKQSGVHFLIMVLTVFPCLLISGWYPLNNLFDFFKILGIFLLVGIVLWSVFYFIFGKLLS
ncbi:DUF3021 family protein [Enterococcus faecalis]|uniref:DUF3021 family protein n=1 Tax=Enterococcus faecalis TaxID=1351 RepID=UPI002A3642AA|nr:DUF3021 family protein [Enterococcus faecalis]